jgi:hypothetical protein
MGSGSSPDPNIYYRTIFYRQKAVFLQYQPPVNGYLAQKNIDSNTKRWYIIIGVVWAEIPFPAKAPPGAAARGERSRAVGSPVHFSALLSVPQGRRATKITGENFERKFVKWKTKSSVF